MTTLPTPVTHTERLRYGALITMMLMAFLLVTAEFVPNGVLTEMADSLGITVGQAGQTVTVTALVGLIIAPTIGLIVPRLDRRSLLVWLAIAAAASNLIVAIAPNFPLVLLARFLLGAALSGFWAMSITVAASIAGPERLGRAVMFNAAGTSLATVAGVPLAVLIAEALNWRAVFVIAGIATGLLAIALRTLLPPVPAAQASSLAVLWNTIRRPGVALGLIGHTLIVAGHSLPYTYIRVALERIGADAADIIVVLIVFGIGGIIGNVVIGLIVDRAYAKLGLVAPLGIAVSALALAFLSGPLTVIAGVAFVWGFFFASWLIIVNTWVGKHMPDRLEAGGALAVVGFQAAIALAAAVGGLLVDTTGVVGAYVLAAGVLVVGAVMFGMAGRAPRRVEG